MKKRVSRRLDGHVVRARRDAIAGAAALAAWGGLALARTALGDTSAYWSQGQSGSWTSNLAWSIAPAYPNNGTPAGTNYDAFVEAGGSAYTVSLNTAVAVNSLTLDSSAATVAVGQYGSLAVNGTLSLQSGTFALGGTLSNATITGNGAFTASGTSAAFSGITIGAGANVQVNPSATFSNGLAFSGGTLSAGGGFASGTLTLTDPSFNITGTGTINLNAAGTEMIMTDGALTLGSGITLQGGAGQISGAALTNNGTITSSSNSMLLGSTTTTNTGTLQAIDGGTLNIGAALAGASWTNSGTIIENNSTLNLNASFSTSDLAGLQRTGGTVTIYGNENNANQTLALNSTTGIFNVNGGTITGGTLTTTTAGYLQIRSGTLDGVSIVGSGNTAISLAGSLTAPSGLPLSNANIDINNGTNDVITLGGAVTGTGSILVESSNSGATNIQTSSSSVPLSFGPSITLTTNGSTPQNPQLVKIGNSSTTVNNQGFIDSTTPNMMMQITGSTINNSGTIQAANGGYVMLTGTLGTVGTIIENNSTLDLNTAGFTPAILGSIQRTGGEINLATTYDNTGSTISLNSGTGSLGLSEGGQITGGTISGTAADPFRIQHALTSTISGTLNGVTIAGNMTVEEGAELNVQNNLNLNSATVTLGTYVIQPPSESNTAIFLLGNGSITGNGTIKFETSFTGDTVAAGNNGSFTIGPNVTIESDTAGGGIGNNSPSTQLIVNQGTISSQTNGQTIYIYGNDFENEGTISASNGGILHIYGLINTGSILVNGQPLVFGSSTTNQGEITIDSGAQVTQGTYSQSSGGTLSYILSSSSSKTSPLFTIEAGSGTLAGELAVQFASGYQPTIGSQWILMQGTAINSQFTSYDLPALASGAFSVQYSANSVTLTVVPEPVGCSLLAAASAAMLLRRRKRFARQR